MIESIVKLFEFLASTKSVARVVVGAATAMVTLFFLYQWAVKITTAIGLASEVALAFLFILAGGVGFLIVDGLFWSGKKTNALWTRRQNKKRDALKEQAKIEALQEKWKSVHTRLRPEELSVLSKFKDNLVEFSIFLPPIRVLQTYGFIQLKVEMIGRTGEHVETGLYCLNPAVEPLVKSFLARRLHENLVSQLTIRLTNEEREFLSLFGTRQQDANQYEHPWLEHEVHMASQTLIRKGVLVEITGEYSDPNKKKMGVISEAIPVIEEYVLKGKIQRESITLDLHNIASGIAGGGSGYRKGIAKKAPA